MVLSCSYQGTNYDIVSQSSTFNSLTWSYYDTDLNLTITLEIGSFNFNNGSNTLDVNWSESNGEAGTSTLNRTQYFPQLMVTMSWGGVSSGQI